MSVLQIIILSIIQGLAELLPVSSSAHVIVAAKLMKLDPTSPEMTLLLVMLHTGTMFAVILYFWSAWKKTFFASKQAFMTRLPSLVLATALTGVIGITIQKIIEKVALRSNPDAEIEMIFGNLGLVAGALAVAGVLILISGLRERAAFRNHPITLSIAAWIGAVQGLCLPFRGFSRSGATISVGMLLGAVKTGVEEFSFALAVILTPPVVAREVLRVIKAQHPVTGPAHPITLSLFLPSLLGMVFAFLGGLVALKWLSGWLEKGHWHWFGVYCLVVSAIVAGLYLQGY